MDSMSGWLQDIQRLFRLMTHIFGVIATLFLINQFMLFYRLLASIHTYLALAVTLIILLLLSYLFYRVWRIYHGPKAMKTLPRHYTRQELLKYLIQMERILRHNPNISVVPEKLPEVEIASIIDEDEVEQRIQLYQTQIESMLSQLESESNQIIQENANALFISTAISQNGVLDSAMVLYTLGRMIYQLARLYETYPTLQSLFRLYSQVITAVLAARSIEDYDLIESQLEPVITSVVGESLASMIPGMVPITNLIISSVLEGSINAFLTLRVGYITQSYLGQYEEREQRQLRTFASNYAIKQMTAILNKNSKYIVKSLAKATKNASVNSARKWFNFDS